MLKRKIETGKVKGKEKVLRNQTVQLIGIILPISVSDRGGGVARLSIDFSDG